MYCGRPIQPEVHVDAESRAVIQGDGEVTEVIVTLLRQCRAVVDTTENILQVNFFNRLRLGKRLGSNFGEGPLTIIPVFPPLLYERPELIKEFHKDTSSIFPTVHLGSGVRTIGYFTTSSGR